MIANYTEKYSELQPPNALKSLIRFFWTFNHIDEDFDFVVLPDACFDLVIDFENGRLNNIFLTGIWTEPKTITVTRGTRLYAIRFKLLAAELLFQNEMKSLLNTMKILPKSFWRIADSDFQSFNTFFTHFSTYIIEILAHSKGIDKRKQTLFDSAYSMKFQRIDDLAEEVNWSSRQMNRYFTSQFGFPLKQFLNIIRCFESYDGIANGNLYPSGFYSDQPHFIRDIKRYTRMTPRQLFKNENDRFIQLTPLKKK